MLFKRLKPSHVRCFLPSFFLNKNEYDEQGTDVLNKKKVGGWQGVVNAFSPDEDGDPSPDVRAILTTVCYSALMGGVYGSLSYSKRAYYDFFEKNQSTLFKNQFEAKSKLQSQITLAMGKGVVKWGSKVGIFCGTFTTIVTVMNAYTQDVSIISYTTAGGIVGGFARLSFGIRGFIVGSTLGIMLGFFVGCFTVLLLKMSPMSMHELKEWQYQAQKLRDESMVKEQKLSKIFQYDSPPELLEHDKRIEKSETIKNNTT